MFLHLTTSCIGNVHQFIASGQTLDNSMKFYLNLFIFYLFRTARKLLDQESTYSEELLKMIFDISIYYLENNPNIEGFDIPHKILNTLILYSPLGHDVTNTKKEMTLLISCLMFSQIIFCLYLQFRLSIR